MKLHVQGPAGWPVSFWNADMAARAVSDAAAGVRMVNAPKRAPRQRSITLVFGKTGMGKTEWTKEYVSTIPRLFALDPMLEYEGMTTFERMDELIAHVQKYRAFQVRTEFAPDFPMLCDAAWLSEDNTLLVEEAQRVVAPGLFKMPAAFEDIVYRGRHRGVSLVLVSQRPTTVHITPRSQWTRMIIFAQTEKADVSWLRDVTGFPLEPTELAPLHYYDVTPSSVETKILDRPWARRSRKHPARVDKGPEDRANMESDVEVQPSEGAGEAPQ